MASQSSTVILPYQAGGQVVLVNNQGPPGATGATGPQGPPGTGGGGGSSLAPTAVKTANYTAAASDFVPVDSTSTSPVITLPTAPADKTQVGAKLVIKPGSNTVTIACGGSDVINKAGGSTSITLTLLNQAVVLQYKASTGIWYPISSDVPLSQLDARYAPSAAPTFTGHVTVPTPTSATDAARKDYTDLAAASAAANAALLSEYGQFAGAPKQPWVPAPARSSNLFTVANLYQGATLGSNTTALNKTTVTPTVTSNGAIQRLTSRIVLPVPGTDNVLGRYRLTFTLSTTTAVGNVLNLIVGPRNGGGITTLAGYSDTTVISVGPSDTALTNFRSTYEFDYQIQSGGAGPTWLDVIISSEGASGGSITINSMDVRQIEWVTPAIWIGWDRAIASGAIINASQPAGRQADGTVMRAHRTFGPDSTLDVGLTAMTAIPESAYSGGYPKSGAATLGNVGPQMQMHTANSGQILTVYKADGVTIELRGNTHGGETGQSGTFTTDYQLFADYQDGNGWTAITDQPWTHRCYRAKIIANTKLTRSDQGSPFVLVSTVYYLYADGTVRVDRTNTFQQDQKMAHWFYHMTSIAPAARFYGKIGAGRKVHGSVDYMDKCPAPVGGTHTTATTGGTIPASPAGIPWSVRVTALTPYGESLPSSTNTSIVTTGSTSTVTANWSAAPSPAGVATSGYAVYFGPAGFERYVGQVAAGVTTFTFTALPLGSAAAPPTSNTAFTGSQTTGSQTDGPFADWSAIFDPYTKMCYSLAVDRDAILAHPGVTGIRGTLIEAVGICKNYWHLTFTGDGGGFPFVVPSGSVFADTLWFFAYMPASLKDFESEQTVRAANVKNLGSLYPVA